MLEGPPDRGRTDQLASETKPLNDEELPESVAIENLAVDAYDDDSNDIFTKANNFVLPRQAKAFGLYPFFKALELNEGPEAIIDGKRVIMLGSNNYLGLTRHPRVVKAAREAVDTYGTSMTGSRLLNGTTKLHEALEEKLASFFGYEDCLTFTTGYQANLGAISALVNRRAAVLVDKADHASIYDGCKFADGEMYRFRHNDVQHLEQLLAAVATKRPTLVVIDGVYSMGGDIAPLPGIVAACKRYGARLLVDDAHGIGVLGEGGRGTASHFGLEKEVDLLFGTFSKSLASIGGFICGPETVVEWIKHFARPGLFSASMSPSAAMAASTALDVLMDEPDLVDKLNVNAKILRDGLRSGGFDIGDTETPIVPVVIGDEVTMVRFWKELLAGGVYTNAVVYPAVPQGAGILRTSCMATHSEEQVKLGVELMCELGRKHRITNN